MPRKRSAKSKPSGPLFPKDIGSNSQTHGHSKNGILTPEYIAWRNMRARCYNKKHVSYPRYGALGVTVCKEWRNSFETFLTDMGKRPADKQTIDRINGALPYNKDNCKWATYLEQNRNKKNVRMAYYKGAMVSLAEVAQRENVKYKTLYHYHVLRALKLSESIGYAIAARLRPLRIPTNGGVSARQRLSERKPRLRAES